MTQRNLSMKQKHIHSHRELTCGCQGEKEREGWSRRVGLADANSHTQDGQTRPHCTAQSASSDKPEWKRIWTKCMLLFSCSHVWFFCDSVDCPAPLSMGLSRQEYWSGLPFPSPGYLPNPGIKLKFSYIAGGFFTTEPWGKKMYTSV